MAGIRFVDATQNSITIELYGMEHPIKDYQNFRVKYNNRSYTIKLASPYRSGNHTIYNLTPGTSYTISVEAQPPKGSQFWPVGNPITARTVKRDNPPASAPPIITKTPSYHGISLRWRAVAGASGYNIYVDGRLVTETGLLEEEVSGLQEDTSYSMSLVAVNAGGEGPYNTFRFRTLKRDSEPPKVSNFSARARNVEKNNFHIDLSWRASDNVGISSIHISWTGANSTKYSRNSSLSSTASSSTLTTDGNYRNFQGGKTYWFQIAVRDTSGNVTTKTDSVAIPDRSVNSWQWSFDTYKGAPFYRQRDKSAYVMTASEWNNFTARINQIRTYMGDSRINFTTARAESEVTAAILNQAISAINSTIDASDRIPQVQRGSVVTGKVFEDIASILNKSIKKNS